MDNHFPKRPHIHIDDSEFAYQFKNTEVLLEDFKNLIFEHFGEKIWKKLIVSVKSTSQALDEIKKRLKSSQRKKGKITPHYEISFTEIRHFKKFISNIDILTSIQLLRPASIYELASMTQKDIGNLNKTINFLEDIGALELEEKKVNGRNVKKTRDSLSKNRIRFSGIA